MRLVISSNQKTGESINLDRKSCRPTRLCSKICYGRFVPAELAKQEGIKANAGPITWKNHQEVYRRNRRLLQEMSPLEIREEALEIAAGRPSGANLRMCGMGDLTFELVLLIAWLAHFGVRPWGFTKRPEMLRQLMAALRGLPPAAGCWPLFQGSTDATMEPARVRELAAATAQLNVMALTAGERRWSGASLAYMTMEPGWVGAVEVEALPYARSIKTVFGYHTNGTKTVVDGSTVCPATNGEPIHCQQCRRCIDGSSYSMAQ